MSGWEATPSGGLWEAEPVEEKKPHRLCPSGTLAPGTLASGPLASGTLAPVRDPTPSALPLPLGPALQLVALGLPG